MITVKNHGYRFVFRLEGESREFNVNDEFFRPKEKNALPHWTKLGFHQCSNCPLSTHTNSHCPPATDILPVIKWASSLHSYMLVTVDVETSEKKETFHTTMQKGLSSLLGVILSLGDCPLMNLFRPEGIYHKPDADSSQIVLKMVAVAMVRELAEKKEQASCREALEKMKAQFLSLQQQNRDFGLRIRDASDEDASINAFVRLDSISRLVPGKLDLTMHLLDEVFR